MLNLLRNFQNICNVALSERKRNAASSDRERERESLAWEEQIHSTHVWVNLGFQALIASSFSCGIIGFATFWTREIPYDICAMLHWLREVSLWGMNPWHSCYEWVLDYRSGLLPAFASGFGGELVGVATFWTCEISYNSCATSHRVREIAMLHPVRGNLAWDQWIQRAYAWANLGIQAFASCFG